jgi:hypothetical protein
MVYTRDRLDLHVHSATVLAQHDIPAPPEWVALRNRFDEFTRAERPALDKLTDAILDGTADDLTALRADALGESNPDLTGVITHVRNRVAVRLADLYDRVAAANYRIAAKSFDSLAGQFTKRANLTDPELPPGEVVRLPADRRDAWVEAEGMARQLDTALDTLTAAAVLAGMDLDDDMELLRLPLVVRTAGCHRRRLFGAWESTGRTGKWGPLARLTKLAAADKPEQVSAYDRPPPIGVRFERDPALGGGHRMIRHDPCDDEKPRLLDRVRTALVGAPAPTDADDWSVD